MAALRISSCAEGESQFPWRRCRGTRRLSKDVPPCSSRHCGVNEGQFVVLCSSAWLYSPSFDDDTHGGLGRLDADFEVEEGRTAGLGRAEREVAAVAVVPTTWVLTRLGEGEQGAARDDKFRIK